MMDEDIKIEEIETADPLKVLLSGDLPDLRRELPRAKVEVPRLSKAAGVPVVFSLRALTYAEVSHIQERGGKASAMILLEGCESPNWRDPALSGKGTGMATPLDVIQARLLPGEIEELAVRIQQLSGYLNTVTVELKNA